MNNKKSESKKSLRGTTPRALREFFHIGSKTSEPVVPTPTQSSATAAAAATITPISSSSSQYSHFISSVSPSSTSVAAQTQTAVRPPFVKPLEIHKTADQVLSCDSSSSSSNSKLSSSNSLIEQRRVRTSSVVVTGSSDAAANYSSMRATMAEKQLGVPFFEYFAVYQQSGAQIQPVYALTSTTSATRAVPTPQEIDRHVTQILLTDFASKKRAVQYRSSGEFRLEFGTMQNHLECCYGDTAFVLVMSTERSKYFLLCVQVPSVLEDACLVRSGVDRNAAMPPALTFHRRAYVLVSSQPIMHLMWSVFEELCLAEIMHLVCKYMMCSPAESAPHVKSGAKLNRLIAMMCEEPMPPAGVSTKINFCGRGVRVKTLPLTEIGFPSLTDYTIMALLRIQVPDIVRILKHLICDYSVIFKGSLAGPLSACMLGVLSILGVFKWVGQVLGILAREQLGVLEAPAPFVGAVLFNKADHAREEEAISDACECGHSEAPLMIVDVDTRRVTTYPEYEMDIPHSDKLVAELSQPVAHLQNAYVGKHSSWILVDGENAARVKEFQTILDSYFAHIINSIRRRLPFKHYVDTADIDNPALVANICMVFPQKFQRFYANLMKAGPWGNTIAPKFTPDNMDVESEGIFKTTAKK